MSKVRFTAWLSEEERNGVKAQADKMGSSENFIFRMAVRKWLGLDTVSIEAVNGGGDPATGGATHGQAHRLAS